MPALRTDERDLLAQVVSVSADAIWTEDLSGAVTSWNASAERVYGVPAGQMLGRPAEDLLPDVTRSELRLARRQALAGQPVERQDSWHRRPDGRHVAVSVTVSPLRGPDGAVVGLATSVQDVTDRVQLAAELEDLRRDLATQNAALLRSNRDLQQFAYVASHDLSEPLRAMTGYVQLLEKRYGDAFDDKGRRWLGHVVEGADRMRRLIDDLLEYSRFLRSGTTAERVDLEAVARAAAVRVRARVPGAVVEVEQLPAVQLDPAAAGSLLDNLLGNAVKFARPGADPHVRVSAEQDGALVRLCVDDDGIGIEPEYRERVFRMFQRLHPREEYGGTGIGLAVVQQVAEAAGGRAWATGSPLGGARLCVTLPRAPEVAP